MTTSRARLAFAALAIALALIAAPCAAAVTVTLADADGAAEAFAATEVPTEAPRWASRRFMMRAPADALVSTIARRVAQGVRGVFVDDAPPVPPGKVHKKPYGDPATARCEAREERVQIQGVPGDFCSPSCSVASPCPEDTYAGANARGMCVLQTPGSAKPDRCALVCNPNDPANGNGGCPKSARCQPVARVGICTYPVA